VSTTIADTDRPHRNESRPPRAIARDLLSLIKPRIAALLSLTGVTAAFAAGGLPAGELAAFVLAGLGMAGGSAALNCYYDRDIDPEMDRTADRPLAAGSLDPRAALAFGVGLLVAASAVALAALPPIAVGYMWLGVASYVGLYTVALKRRHWLGVVLGGSAGSFPVLAGWTAVRPLSLPAVVMAALVFAWTPAHAWALAVVYREDFAAAGIPTLPVVASPRRVRRAVWHSALVTAALALSLAPFVGPVYLAAALPAVAGFLGAYRAFARRGGDARAVRAFFTSNAALAAVFVGWGVSGVADGAAVALVVGAVATLFLAGTWAARPALADVRAAPGPDWGAMLGRACARVWPISGP
jgi:protoheme IX farnesyltransferase